jgi:hypothetical protein
VDAEPRAAAVGDDFERLREQLGQAHRLDHVLVARRAHLFREHPLNETRLACDRGDILLCRADSGGELLAGEAQELLEVGAALCACAPLLQLGHGLFGVRDRRAA